MPAVLLAHLSLSISTAMMRVRESKCMMDVIKCIVEK